MRSSPPRRNARASRFPPPPTAAEADALLAAQRPTKRARVDANAHSGANAPLYEPVPVLDVAPPPPMTRSTAEPPPQLPSAPPALGRRTVSGASTVASMYSGSPRASPPPSQAGLQASTRDVLEKRDRCAMDWARFLSPSPEHNVACWPESVVDEIFGRNDEPESVAEAVRAAVDLVSLDVFLKFGANNLHSNCPFPMSANEAVAYVHGCITQKLRSSFIKRTMPRDKAEKLVSKLGVLRALATRNPSNAALSAAVLRTDLALDTKRYAHRHEVLCSALTVSASVEVVARLFACFALAGQNAPYFVTHEHLSDPKVGLSQVQRRGFNTQEFAYKSDESWRELATKMLDNARERLAALEKSVGTTR